MEFQIEIEPRAQADLDEIFEWVTVQAPYRGLLWFERLEGAIRSLGTFPERCPVASEMSRGGQVARRLAFGWKPNEILVYYTIDQLRVQVVHVRHGRRLGPELRSL